MKPSNKVLESRTVRRVGAVVVSLFALCGGVAPAHAQATMPNACPVDGCEVRIVEVERNGDELQLTFKANFSPDLSKNHIHIWWGESFTVKQVSRNAEPVHNVKQGAWHLTDDYPSYTTQGPASVGARDGAKSLCVSTSDRNHNIIDVNAFHCVDVSDKL